MSKHDCHRFFDKLAFMLDTFDKLFAIEEMVNVKRINLFEKIVIINMPKI